MKKILFTFCFLLFAIHSFSQVNTLYNDTISTITNDIEKYDDNNYFFTTFTSVTGYYKSKIKHIDKNGNFINEKSLIKTNTNIQTAARNCLIIKNNNIYILNNETYYGDTTKYFYSLTCYNYNFDTIWNKKYFGDTTIKFINTIINTKDNGFAFAGIISKNNEYNNCVLLKTDSVGNLLWNKEFGYTNVYDKITNILQTQDSGYILSGSSEKYNRDNWYIVRTDSLGNQIWDWVLQNPFNISDGPVGDLIQTQDGNFVAIGGQTYESNAAYTVSNARLLKFDINKNILRDTLFYERFESRTAPDTTHSTFIKIAQNTNGNFIIIGYKQGISGQSTVKTSYLYETDNLFNIIKKREFRALCGRYNNYFFKDFIVDDNNSLALIGDIYTDNLYPQQQVWFVKTDANYCDGFGSCDTIFDAELTYPDTIYKTDTVSLNIKIKSDINIEYNVLIGYYQKDKFFPITYDTLKYVYPDEIKQLPLSYNDLVLRNLHPQNTIIDTIYLKYEIAPSDSSSHMDKFSFLSDNMIVFREPDTTQNINQLNNAKRSLVIYPNPATSSVSLMFTAKTNLTDNTVFVYDAYGRVVKQLKIKNNNLQINIIDLERGIYFVRVGSAIGKFVKE